MKNEAVTKEKSVVLGAFHADSKVKILCSKCFHMTGISDDISIKKYNQGCPVLCWCCSLRKLEGEGILTSNEVGKCLNNNPCNL